MQAFSAEQVLLSWLAVLSSTYERPGLLSLCSLFSACSASALILAGIAVLLCAMLLADLCAVADLERAAGHGGEPGRAAYERQAMQLASVHLDSDQPAGCRALLAGPAHVGAAVIDGVLPVTLPHQRGGQQEASNARAQRERERCGRWLQGHSTDYYDSGTPGVGFGVANMSGHWPTGHHYIDHCTHAAAAEVMAVCVALPPLSLISFYKTDEYSCRWHRAEIVRARSCGCPPRSALGSVSGCCCQTPQPWRLTAPQARARLWECHTWRRSPRFPAATRCRCW